jgi:hypothetical protein
LYLAAFYGWIREANSVADSLAKFAVKDMSFFVVVIAGCFGWSFLMKDCFLAKKEKEKEKALYDWNSC